MPAMRSHSTNGSGTRARFSRNGPPFPPSRHRPTCSELELNTGYGKPASAGSKSLLIVQSLSPIVPPMWAANGLNASCSAVGCRRSTRSGGAKCSTRVRRVGVTQQRPWPLSGRRGQANRPWLTRSVVGQRGSNCRMTRWRSRAAARPSRCTRCATTCGCGRRRSRTMAQMRPTPSSSGQRRRPG